MKGLAVALLLNASACSTFSHVASTDLAPALRRHGYRTGIIGKWHLGMQIPGIRGQRDWHQRVSDGPL